MADFITNDVSLDRNGRNDGWFIQPEGDRPCLFLSNEEIDALVAWRNRSAESSVEVPVSLIERIDSAYNASSDTLAALIEQLWMLTQPTPTAEPGHRVSVYPASGSPEDERLTIVAECTSCGRMGTWLDSAEGNGQARAFADLHSTLPTAPPRIEDMAPGTTVVIAHTWQVVRRPNGATFLYRDHDGYGQWAAPSDIDPSTIRDVTPPYRKH